MCKILLIILSFFCPPLAVIFDQGCTKAFWINCCLTICFWIPGVIHAIWVIITYHSHRYHGERIVVVEHHHDHCRY